VRARLSQVEVSPRQFELAALVSLIALTLIVMTGAAVRLTDSGLGCPDWPRCYGHVYPPLHTHSLIEFGNRAVGALVGVVTVLTALLAWRRRPFRRDLFWLALALPLGVVAQAVLGGYTVEEKLAPGFVMAHFALSMVILVAAVALYWQARERIDPVPRAPDRLAIRTVRALVPFAAIVIVAGSVTTGAGPHSGGTVGQTIKRITFAGSDTLNVAVHIHGALAFAFGIFAVLVWVLLERRQADRRLRIAMMALCALIALQGVVGAIQYDTHLPTELVWIHVTLATLTWLSVLWAVAAAGRLEPLAATQPTQIRASVAARNG
jgi:heme a synthase